MALRIYHKTRFKSSDGQRLYFRRYDFLGGSYVWRIVHYDPSTAQNHRFSPVGPQYARKDELLADLNRFATEFGF